MKVPKLLLSGHHANIKKWRHEQSLITTLKKRPELLENYPLTQEDMDILNNSDKAYKE